MKNMNDGLKILFIVIIALLVIAAAVAALLLLGGQARYETVDTQFNPASELDLRSEVALTPAEIEETPAPAPEPDPAAVDDEADAGDSAEDPEEEPAEDAESPDEAEEAEPDEDGFYAVEDTVTVTGDSVNVRSEPNTNCEILGSLSRGQTLSRTGYNDDNWARIEYNGKTAYVSGDYVE